MPNVEVFTQNSIRISGGNGKIYIDPFRMREEPKDADEFAGLVESPVKVEVKMKY